MGGPMPKASALNWEAGYTQFASRVSGLSAFFVEMLQSSDLPADLMLQVRETKSRCDDLVASCEKSKSVVAEYVSHAIDRLDEVPSLLEKPSKLGRRLRSVRGDIENIQERLSRQDRACADAESSIERLTSLLKAYASKVQEDKTNQQIGAIVAGVMCLGFAVYAFPAIMAGGTAAGGAAASGSAALVAESSAAAAVALAAESAAVGAGAAVGSAAVAAEGVAVALSAEAALAGSAMAGASAMVLKEGANGCDKLVGLLNLQMEDLEGQRRGVKEAESTCQDLLNQVTLASRDYGDAEDAFSERDLEDLVSFVRDAKQRLTGLMDNLDTSDAQLVTSDLTVL